MKSKQSCLFATAMIIILVLTACPEPPITIVTTGSISGRAIFNNTETGNDGITITLERANGLLSASVVDANRAISSGARSISGISSIAGTTFTNPDGSFSFSGIPEGDYIVYASSQNSLEKAVARNITVIANQDNAITETLNLTPVGSITGKITPESGSPMGFLVSVAGYSYMAMTNNEGIFTISGIPASLGNSYSIIIMKGNYVGNFSDEPVSVAAGAVPVNIGEKQIDNDELLYSIVSISADGFWVINGVKTTEKARGEDGQDGTNGTNGTKLTSPAEVSAYLASASGGSTTANAIDLAVQFPLGNMKASNSGWQQLLAAIEDNAKYVNLDLSACSMRADGVFDPDYNVEEGKKWIVKLILPDAATSIPDWDLNYGYTAFWYFSNLTEISGENILHIGDHAFVYIDEDGDIEDWYLGNLTIVNFPAVKSIGGAAFAATNLVEVSFPMVESIGDDAFIYCTGLVEANFPMLKSIGERAFENCTSLVEASFPMVESIGPYAFEGCTSLVEVNFPNVEIIGAEAFANCTSLVDVNFPKVKSIGGGAFAATNLVEVSFPMVESIGNGAFENCTNLVDVSFPASVNFFFDYNSHWSRLGSYAFRGCINLVTFNFIGSGGLSFYEDNKILIRNTAEGKELIVYHGATGQITMDDITSVGMGAFYNASVTSFSFPNATSFGYSALRGGINLVEINIPMAETFYGGNISHSITSLTITIAPNCNFKPVTDGEVGCPFFNYYEEQSRAGGTYIRDNGVWTGPF